MISLSSDFFVFTSNAKKVSNDDRLNQEHSEFHPLIPSVHSLLHRIGNFQFLLKCRMVAAFKIMWKNAPELVTKKMSTERIDNERLFLSPLIHLILFNPVKNFSARHSRRGGKKRRE